MRIQALLLVVGCGMLIHVPGAGATDQVPVSAAGVRELKRAADPWLTAVDDVTVRKHASDLYALIDAYGQLGRSAEAAPYLERVLKADPRAYRYQLMYGKILAQQGQAGELSLRAKQAAAYAEEDDIIREARDLAGLGPVAPPTALATSVDSQPELVLLSCGDVSAVWLAELQRNLRAKLGIRVLVESMPLEFGPPSRTAYVMEIAEQRKRLFEAIKADRSLGRLLTTNGYDLARLESDDAMLVKAMKFLAKREGNLAKYNAHLAKLQEADAGQWRADVILAALEEKTRPFQRSQRWFLAVTSHDIYTSDANFVFGSAYVGGAVAVMSATRFTAAFNHDSEHRPQLIARMSKQALSSFGQMLGVPRCTNPDCARAYPHSLAEHDAKSGDLCGQCALGFAGKLAVAP